MAVDTSDPKQFKGAWHEISEDELNHRMELKRKLRDEPVQKAVAMIEAAMDKVMESLGVDTSRDDIPLQQEALGILITEHTDERAPQLNGFFIYVARGNDLVPYAWVGSARVDSTGEVLVDIHWFQREKATQIGGLKLRRPN